ncbi:MAG: citrate/2-methylcitrate synthase [Clostridia bacterium]|nr:citrate/2-methylcitrate synthase [Clostridia bacterium]
MAYELLKHYGPQIDSLSELCISHDQIPQELYTKHEVKRGLRDISGQGVLAGLTEIGEIKAYDIVDGNMVPTEGQLFYRGHEIKDLVRGFMADERQGFDEITYLLLFGELPNMLQLNEFRTMMRDFTQLPKHFVRDIIMKVPTKDVMNILARSVLTLYGYDPNPDDTSIPNVLRQCLELIARFPMIAVYGYQAHQYYDYGNSFYVHNPKPEYGVAENILHMLREDSQFTALEARILDLALVLHMEHGGGNNSTFTTHVVSSSGTDTYSAVAASLGSLKGPRHGGANVKVTMMFDDMKLHIRDWTDEDEIRDYLKRILNREAFDRSGLIYGMGHAVYSLSDPRADIFRSFVRKLSDAKGEHQAFELYERVERLAPKVIAEERRMYKGVSANVDFYSGFVYELLGLPPELYTPIFAIARIVGWSAHRIEELISNGKIIRPAYKAVGEKKEYVPLKERR